MIQNTAGSALRPTAAVAAVRIADLGRDHEDLPVDSVLEEFGNERGRPLEGDCLICARPRRLFLRHSECSQSQGELRVLAVPSSLL